MKWEPLVAMAALFLLGVWLVYSPTPTGQRAGVTPGARTAEFRLGPTRGVLEIVPPEPGAADGTGPSFRILYRSGEASPVLTEAQFRAMVGDETYRSLVEHPDNPVFRLLNITSWASVVWVAVGFAGQLAFFGRMAVQWLVSEKQRQSVVPDIFWWLSLFGGVALFTYFVWRRDVVAVMGQSTGVVIYARNIRLIHKKKRRDERRLKGEGAGEGAAAARPS